MVIRGISDQCHYARSNTGHDIRYAYSIKLITYPDAFFVSPNKHVSTAADSFAKIQFQIAHKEILWSLSMRATDLSNTKLKSTRKNWEIKA